jgi:EAL domain-containing protein (putative c-di-GMP-specific phosphodiesterase class I)
VIEQVITTRAFDPVFQPIADLRSREIVGFEALTRFEDGTAPAPRFKEAAEMGVGVQLEQVTLGAAIDAAERLPPGRFLSVNVSPALILERATIALVKRAGPAGSCWSSPSATRSTTTARSRASSKSSGASSSPSTTPAPGTRACATSSPCTPSYIKLDITWVRGIDDDTARQALVAGIHHFATLTNCRVIAEGIETEGESETLRRIGIEFGQGYLFGRPAPVDELASAPSSV